MEGFLKRNFEWLHGRCEKSWMSAIGESFEIQRNLILSDVQLRHPNMNSGSKFEGELTRFVEFDAPLLGGLLYRIERGIFVNSPNHEVLSVLAHLMRFRTGMEIYYSTNIGPRLRIQHGRGLVIGPHYQIGSDLTIYQGVTIGQKNMSVQDQGITIGDRCQIFSGAKVLGTLQIGNDVKIGANAVLLENAESASTYVGIPAQRVKATMK